MEVFEPAFDPCYIHRRFGAPPTKYVSKNINIVMCLPIRCLETDSYIVVSVNFRGNVFTEPLPSNDTISYLLRNISD
jgi:hypothetical protein